MFQGNNLELPYIWLSREDTVTILKFDVEEHTSIRQQSRSEIEL